MSAPILLFPTNPEFATNMSSIELSGSVPIGSFQVLVNDVPITSYDSNTGGWSYNAFFAQGDNVYNIYYLSSSGGTPSGTLVVSINYSLSSDLGIVLTPPTGLYVKKYFSSVECFNIQNPEPEVFGYNYYVSEEKGGGLTGYRKINSTIVSDYSTVQEIKTQTGYTQVQVGDIRTTTVTEQITNQYYYSYTHDRSQDALITVPDSEPLYYVITAVAKDTNSTILIESPYSSEIATKTLLQTTEIQQLPARTQSDVAITYINRILRIDPTIDVKPLSITRDLIIDPPSEEFARLYLILDFIHRSQSIPTLMDIDDPENTGSSTPVLTSSYKNALRECLMISEQNADQVQLLIDSAFTKIAKNAQVDRKPAQQAQGEVIFYTKKLPVNDRTIAVVNSIVQTKPRGSIPAVSFLVLSQIDFKVAESSNYYNPDTQQYEYPARVQAVDAGTIGNVEAYSIEVPVSGIDPNFKVTNIAATVFGMDQESNRSLAERTLLAFISVDSGTEPGYLAHTLAIPGVQYAKIEKAGDTYMMRDYDPIRKKHIGGKVDIFILAESEKSTSDQFSFQFASVSHELVRIKNVTSMEFAVLNTSVTVDTPIYEVTRLRNATKAEDYDLTNMLITGDGNIIDLDETRSRNIAIGIDPDDVVYIDYRYRSGSVHKFSELPVASVSSVVGNISGSLPSTNYKVYKTDDPLLTGGSVQASDQLQIIFANGIPLSQLESIVDEVIILISDTKSTLANLGVQQNTVIVTDSTKTITYVRGTDYELLTSGEATQIYRLTTTSTIVSGATVLVSYQSSENFTVTYTYNSTIADVQTEIEEFRHLTADVIAKEVLKTRIDIEATIVLDPGLVRNNRTTKSKANINIRTNIARLIGNLKIGQSLYESDVIRSLDEAVGVSYVVLPLTKMAKADGSLQLREAITGSWLEYQTGLVYAYISADTLTYQTIAGGGDITTPRGIYEDDIALTLVDDPNEVSLGAGRGYIGADGKVIISTYLSDDPTLHKYSCTYIVSGETGSKDILVSEIEKIELNRLDLTFVEQTVTDTGF